MVNPIFFDDASEFLSVLRQSHPRWTDSNGSWHQEWVFRGQRDAKWTVEPSAWRKEIETNPLYRSFYEELTDEQAWGKVKGYAPHFGGDDEKKKLTSHRIYAFKKFEYHAVRAFVELADEIGFRVPEARKLIEGKFRYSELFSAPYVNADNLPTEDFSDAMLLAQHHGIPTRFVDWARDPIIAACFATHGWTGETDVAVYALNKIKIRPTLYRLVMPTRFEFGFLHAQGGLFTLRSRADEGFCQNGVWPILDNELNSHVLQKLVLRCDSVDELKRLLWLERRTKAHLMPTLDNVTATLNEVWDNYIQPIAKCRNE